jgi:hypothetical protein
MLKSSLFVFKFFSNHKTTKIRKHEIVYLFFFFAFSTFRVFVINPFWFLFIRVRKDDQKMWFNT